MMKEGEFSKLCKERSEELKNCPDCGGRPKIEYRISLLGGEHYQTRVRCQDCWCATDRSSSIDETIAFWNGRKWEK